MAVEFPGLSEQFRRERLKLVDHKIKMVLDTDTYNEIDDQFALAYALLSPDKLDVEAVYAAPFLNDRSSSPGEGMEKSYEEIFRVLERLHLERENFVFRGSQAFLESWEKPQESEAVANLIERAKQFTDEPLYVVAIGAITNVASAILLEPSIIEHIVVVWLGGQPPHWPSALDFNSGQDTQATRVILDSGVPYVSIPCFGVSSHLLTTVAELERDIGGKNALCDFLVENVRGYSNDHFAWAKEIWDVAAIAWLLNPDWVPSMVEPTPVLTDKGTWQLEPGRHLFRWAYMVYRNPIFRDLFQKLASAK